jgi:hypothetical protein
MTRDRTLTPTWLTILSLFLGAGIGFLGTYFNERAKEKKARKYRWDQPLFDLAKEFAAAVRLLVHLCGRFDRAEDKAAWKKRVDDVHGEVRSLTQQIRILASSECYQAAREVLHHVYAVRTVSVEGKPDARSTTSRLAKSPEERLEEAMTDFLVKLRIQLEVGNPHDVEIDKRISERDPWTTAPTSQLEGRQQMSAADSTST